MVAKVPHNTSFIELFASVDGGSDGGGNSSNLRLTRARWPNGAQNRGAVFPSGYLTGTYKGDDQPRLGKFSRVADPSSKRLGNDDSPFQTDSWMAGGAGRRYDPPFMFKDNDDLATKGKPTSLHFDTPPPRRGASSNWTNIHRALLINAPLTGAGSSTRRAATTVVRRQQQQQHQPGIHRADPESGSTLRLL
jgi:hypothetical protein